MKARQKRSRGNKEKLKKSKASGEGSSSDGDEDYKEHEKSTKKREVIKVMLLGWIARFSLYFDFCE